MKEKELSLKTYLDLSELLGEYSGKHEENRAFALKHKELKNRPQKLLMTWLEENRYRISKELKSKSYMTYLSSITTLLALFSIIIGLIVGSALLSYSGHAPVNIIYYLLMAIAIPVLSMFISTVSMISRGSLGDFFTHLLPLHWIEKIFMLIPFRSRERFLDCQLSLNLTKWLFLQRIQLFSLLFSIGLLFALLVTVLAKDIAFGWSTTLQVSPESFHSLLGNIGFLWQNIIPNAIPSLELVEISQYFRLGEKINTEMVQNADKLGAWWQFLAISTLVYAIILRFTLWIISKIGFRRVLEKEFLEIDGIHKVLREFQTPFVSTKSLAQEKHLEIAEESKEQVSTSENIDYNQVVAWNFSSDELALIVDNQGLKSSSLSTVGGSNSFTEDEEIANSAEDEQIFFVKAWEPPTMDFVDFLELLIENEKVSEIKVYPLGTAEKYYQSKNSDIAIWKRKIQALKSKKVWVVDDTK